MRLKDRGKQPAVAAADVGDAVDAGEIQRLDDRAGPREGLAREIGGEDIATAKILIPPRPHIGAEHMIEGGCAGLQSRDEIRPGLPVLLDDNRDLLAEPRRRARFEGLAEGRKREVAIGALLTDAEGRKAAQEAEEVGRR